MIPKLLRKRVRGFVAHASLQPIYRTLYRVALIGMNYGGAGSTKSSGDDLALERLSRTGGPWVVFDVGANIGSYAARVLELLGPGVEIHAFEPSSAAFARLEHHFGDHTSVRLVSAGLSSAEGTATLYSDAPGSVLASTYREVHGTEVGESIPLMTLDAYCDRLQVRSIDLLKLDVEGGELAALLGAKETLGKDRIKLIQFEFGQPSLASHTNFGDLFRLLHAQYSIHRVLPNGLVELPSYHETLEVFMSTNYLAVARAWEHRTSFLSKR